MKKQVRLILSGILCLMVSQSLFGNEARLLFEKEELLKVIRDISYRYDVHFTYDREIVEDIVVDNYNPDQYHNVDDVLAKVLSNTKLKYVMLEMKYVIIYRDDAAGMESLQQMVKVLQTIIDDKKLTKSSLSVNFLSNHDRIDNLRLTRHRMVLNVSGQVKDASGQPLIGVNVLVKGSGVGTATDIDGNYTITDVNENATLVFSYIGYQSQEIVLNGRSNINITLFEDSKTLDEVVVVGYGTQKKVNLTGAVDHITNEHFEKRAMTSISQGLQGALPNLNIVFSDGKPSRSPSYNIRGTTSIGQGGNALVLIDGVEGDPSLINPNDIESVSILKDAASASIYGARASFGVILINTKSAAEGKFNISYTGNYSVKQPAAKPDYVTDGYLWASMFSESFSAWNDYNSIAQNVNKSLKFSLDYLEELKRRSEDPSLPKLEIDQATGEYIYYSNTDWYGELYKTNMFSHDQNLSISGSTKKTNFYLSGRYLNQPGIFKYNSDDYNSYNVRAKGFIQPLEWLSIQNNTSFSKNTYHYPYGANESNIWRGLIYDSPPMSPITNPDGTFTHAAAFSLGGFLQGKSGVDSDRSTFNNMTSFTAKMYKDILRLKGNFNFNTTQIEERTLRLPLPYSRFEGAIEYVGSNNNDINEVANKSNYIASNIFSEYENSIDDHYLKVLIGGNFESFTNKGLTVYRNGLIFDGAENINVALGQSISTSGDWEQWVGLGGFFRVNYSFMDKYLLELNGRYDGSSKFPAHDRFAFFPSVSVGWRLSEESFWRVNHDFISNLKFRFSYGALGNGSINSYAYIESFNVDRLSRIINGVRPQFTRQSNVLPNELTWETATTSNIGFDLSLANYHVNIVADAYIRKTTDMYTQGVTLPAVFGAESPKGNYADLETKGWEVSIDFNDQFNLAAKPFNYSVRFGISDYVSKILKYNNVDKRLNDYYVGQTIGEIWGFETGGFFLSEAEIDSWPDQSLYKSSTTGTTLPGDIKFVDLNNDGVIDIGNNTVDNPGDQKIIGNSEGRYRFGLNLNFEWNSFFFNSFFQGIGQQDWWPDRNSAAFWGQYVAPYADIPSFHIGNIWTEDNLDAYFPRYRGYIALGGSRSLHLQQTKYLQNAAYVRMKNIQFGYSLPDNFLSKINAQNMQIYFSGENLWTYSPFYKLVNHIDVENIRNADPDINPNAGGGYSYPILKSLTLGLTVTF